jgi:hypothetical protein
VISVSGPIYRRGLVAKVRSRTLPLVYVGQSILEVRTRPRWLSHLMKGSANTRGIYVSKGYYLV